jgi:hypothetical protein
MSVDINSKMIVGCKVEDINWSKVDGDEDVHDFAEKHGMVVCSECYDGNVDDWWIGYEIRPELTQDIDYEWLISMVNKGECFWRRTGRKATLQAVNDVY